MDQFAKVHDETIGAVVPVKLHPVEMMGSHPEVADIAKYVKGFGEAFPVDAINLFVIPEQANCCLEDLVMENVRAEICLLYTSPSPRDRTRSRMPSSA